MAASASSILTVRAHRDPGSLARVSNIFSQRGIIPQFLCCKSDGAFLLIEVQLAAEDGEINEALLERVRALVCVDRADYVQGGGRGKRAA